MTSIEDYAAIIKDTHPQALFRPVRALNDVRDANAPDVGQEKAILIAYQ